MLNQKRTVFFFVSDDRATQALFNESLILKFILEEVGFVAPNIDIRSQIWRESVKLCDGSQNNISWR